MSTLRPAVPVQVFKATGFDGYSQPIYAAVAINEMCSVVKNDMTEAHSNIRADGSGSRGYAYEWVASNRILVPPTTAIAFSDLIILAGYKLRVKALWPQFDVWGRLDHYDLQAEAWQ